MEYNASKHKPAAHKCDMRRVWKGECCCHGLLAVGVQVAAVDGRIKVVNNGRSHWLLEAESEVIRETAHEILEA